MQFVAFFVVRRIDKNEGRKGTKKEEEKKRKKKKNSEEEKNLLQSLSTKSFIELWKKNKPLKQNWFQFNIKREREREREKESDKEWKKLTSN